MKHECLVGSETATADEMAKCYQTRPHMDFWCGAWTLKRTNGVRIRAPKGFEGRFRY